AADDFGAVVVVVGVEGVLIEGGAGHDHIRSAFCCVVFIIIARDGPSRKVVVDEVDEIAARREQLARWLPRKLQIARPAPDTRMH
ncbi:MAG: hypothetical protein ACOCWJ_02130, partial [Verrucomicrobiota bacterium]